MDFAQFLTLLKGGPSEQKMGPPMGDIDLPYEGPWAHVPEEIRIAIQRAAEKHQLPIDRLFRQVRTESSFNPKAQNQSTEGLMQLSPLIQDHYNVEDPQNPMENVDAGAQYLKELIEKYGGNYSLALAAYNAGPTAVKKHGGIPPFKITQDYVRKIIAGK